MNPRRLDERIAAASARRTAAAEASRVQLDTRLIDMAARWNAAEGLGPLPGEDAAHKALQRGHLPLARRAVAVAEVALRRREAIHLGGQAPPPPPVPPASAEPEIAAILGELLETGRPVRALEPEERARLTGADAATALEEVRAIRRRIRLEARRVRLLFDLDRLPLPPGLAHQLARRADTEDPLKLRQEMLDALGVKSGLESSRREKTQDQT